MLSRTSIPLIIEHRVTRDGCTVGRPCGEFQIAYWPNPPSGQGWVEATHFKDESGEPHTLWRRFQLGLAQNSDPEPSDGGAP